MQNSAFEKIVFVSITNFFPTRKPNKLSVVWTRRSRRVSSDPLEWEPGLSNPLKGAVIWSVPDNHTVSVTLFKDPRTHELEDKDWTFVIEDVIKKKEILFRKKLTNFDLIKIFNFFLFILNKY